MRYPLAPPLKLHKISTIKTNAAPSIPKALK
jgi:hypothetical protein